MKLHLIIGLLLPLVIFAVHASEQDYKNLIRKSIIEKSKVSTKSKPLYNDDVQDLFPEIRIERNLLSLPIMGSVKEQPWSDDYWPIYKGILGARYTDPKFLDQYVWIEAKDYIENNPVPSELDTKTLNRLSPSEKFDLLIGLDTTKLNLTKSMWEQGEQYYAQHGSVEKWMGICHGWAPASFMVKRPTNAIIVKDAQNRDIRFFPSDIKALVSLLWASGDYQSYFVGSRCNSKEPEEDEFGRVIRQECYDNNPATFHMALANGIGIHRKSFVMDATYDYEVWNQPISSFNMEFFNPETNEGVESLKDAIISIDQLSEDVFKKRRNKLTKYIVGVSLEVSYIVETDPNHRIFDLPDFDGVTTAYYNYDLELDEHYKIIGGEWHDNEHPDFLWRPRPNTKAISYFDYFIMSDKEWNGKAPLAKSYRDLANKAAQNGLPLAYIVNSLVKLSQENEERVDD